MKFRDNRRPSLEFLNQKQTYFGLYEGVPTAEINRDYVAHAQQDAKTLFSGLPLYLVPPIEKVWTNNSGSAYASLPGVTCIAYLSDKPMNPDMECSRLIVLWYQDSYALPIAPHILEHLSGVDWETVSEDSWNL